MKGPVLSLGHFKRALRDNFWQAPKILDIGARIDELRNLKKDQIDFDQCVLLIDKGKGRKQRQLPFSL